MRLLYSNDTTHIVTCNGPYHRYGEKFTTAMLEASIDETAGTGVDVHMLQPGLGNVPWWKSRQYPFEEHLRWFEATYGPQSPDDPYTQWMLDGGDMLDVFVRRCRARDLSPIVSMRLNDGHGKEFVNGIEGPSASIPGLALYAFNRFYQEHPEFRIGSDLNDWRQRVLNWAEPEVREWMFGFIREICEDYDIDGFELDFMRFCAFFRQHETSSEFRRSTMTDFVRAVRELLDRTARGGRRRWLGVRVPAHAETHDALGIDIEAFAEVGVEVFNFSVFFCSQQQSDVATLVQRLPERARAFQEVTHCTLCGEDVVANSKYDHYTYRRTTDNQFYTTAHLAYARGLHGMSTFNFVYYREHGGAARGPFCEPPWHVLPHLRDPEWLAEQPQHYCLFTLWDQPQLGSRPLNGPGGEFAPRRIEPGEKATFELDMAPPRGGWREGGRLRIRSPHDLGASEWMAALNGVQLEPTHDRSEPYNNPYPALLGTAGQHRAWVVPPKLLLDGINQVVVELVSGTEALQIDFLDVAVA